jgi:hypothetical protein
MVPAGVPRPAGPVRRGLPKQGGGRKRAGRGCDTLLGGGQRERGSRAKPKAGDLRAGPGRPCWCGQGFEDPGARCKGSALAVTSTTRHNEASGARVLGCLFIGSRRFARWCCCPAVFLFRSLRPTVDSGGGRPDGRGGVPLGRRPWGRRRWGAPFGVPGMLVPVVAQPVPGPLPPRGSAGNRAPGCVRCHSWRSARGYWPVVPAGGRTGSPGG